jgi:hypothetical protein
LAENEVALLIVIEEFGTSRVVEEKEEARDADGNGGYTFDDEDLIVGVSRRPDVAAGVRTNPAPTSKSSGSVELGNSKGKETREGATSGCRSVENGDSSLRLVGQIPVRDDQDSSGQEASPMPLLAQQLDIQANWKLTQTIQA